MTPLSTRVRQQARAAAERGRRCPSSTAEGDPDQLDLLSSIAPAQSGQTTQQKGGMDTDRYDTSPGDEHDVTPAEDDPLAELDLTSMRVDEEWYDDSSG